MKIIDLVPRDSGSLNINALPEKITPENTDNLAIQETGGLLKKLSFANLKLWILSLFNPSITGTVSFDSTTNNISIANIVASLGLEIGDVIQISGAEDAKNNSEFTIEVITDNDNIIVNQAHANKGTTKNVANRSGDTGVTVKLLAKWFNAPIGLGQGWVDVKPARSSGVSYVNSTNRSIEISVSSARGNQGDGFGVVVSGILIANPRNRGATGDTACSHSFTVSKDNSYTITWDIGTVGVWAELR